MEPSIGDKVTEWGTHILWFDHDGILYGKPMKGKVLRLEDIRPSIEYLVKELNGKKVGVLLDFTHFTNTTREIREYISVEFPKIAAAVAMVSRTPLGKMLANLFFSLKVLPYPTKMFNDENEAREWLKENLQMKS